jgi:hypothetical protein
VFRTLSALCAFFLLCAQSQAAPPVPPPGSVISTTSFALTVTTTSSNVQLTGSTTTFPFANVVNDGTSGGEAFVNIGTTNGTTATASNIPVPNGKCVTIYMGVNTWVAAIGTASTTMHVTQSNGAACPR